MATSTVTPTAGGISSGEQTRSRVPKKELGEEEFLQILAVQLANQDPLQPMEDTDFIAQMAQFNSLQQMQQLNATFNTSQAYSLIGKNVVGEVQENDGSKAQILGRVTGVVRQGGTDYVQVGDYYLPIGAITEIYDAGMDTNTMISQAANLVGKNVEALVPEEVKDAATGETVTKNVKVEGEVEAILVKNGVVYAKLKDTDTQVGKEVPVAYITKIS